MRNRVRGANPMPGAFTSWSGGGLKVHRAQLSPGEGTPGTVLIADGRDGIVVACGRGALRVTQVQPEGRPRMMADAFVRGYRLAVGERLGSAPPVDAT